MKRLRDRGRYVGSIMSNNKKADRRRDEVRDGGDRGSNEGWENGWKRRDRGEAMLLM